MTTRGIPRATAVVRKAISDTLKSWSREHYNLLSDTDRKWACDSWMKAYEIPSNSDSTTLSSEPERFYRGLIFANRESSIGRFAITWNLQLFRSISSRDYNSFRSSLLSPVTPEIDDNSHLSEEERKGIFETVENEMNSLNRLLDAAIYSNDEEGTMETLLNTERHDACKRESQYCINDQKTKEVSFDSWRRSKAPLYISELHPESEAPHVYCFDILELFNILWFNRDNPYTGRPFTDETRSGFFKRFQLETKLFIRSLELGGPWPTSSL